MLSGVTAILETAIIYSAILRCQVLRGASTCCGRDADILVLFHAGLRKILDEMQLYRLNGTLPESFRLLQYCQVWKGISWSPWLSAVASRELGTMSLCKCRVSARNKNRIHTHLSPVSSDLSNRRSAGTQSPVERTTILLMTISLVGMSCCFPSRMTAASSAMRDLMDFMILLVFQSTSA